MNCTIPCNQCPDEQSGRCTMTDMTGLMLVDLARSVDAHAPVVDLLDETYCTYCGNQPCTCDLRFDEYREMQMEVFDA
jgi:hypothetical protein